MAGNGRKNEHRNNGKRLLTLEQERGIERKLQDMELFISRALRIGVTISGIVIAIGLAWLLLSWQWGQTAFPRTFAGIWRGLLTGHPFAVIDLGLVILILTPVFRVAASTFLFVREKDKLYAGITIFVLFMLVLSFTLGKAG